ncbi:hypothetical protein V8E55_006528 [Tylopilus felleus]
MVLSHEDEHVHPYWYAHVVEVFHVMVQSHNNPYSLFSAPSQMNVLLVRWFCHNINYLSGWQEKRLHQLQFFDQANPSDVFGFIDPDSVVRGAHFIPTFAYGHTNNLLAHHIDWKYYYVNMFVDRDMFMRMRGGDCGRPVENKDSNIVMGDEENELDGSTQQGGDTGDLDVQDAQNDVGEPNELPDEWEDDVEWEGMMALVGGKAEDDENDEGNYDGNASDTDESNEDDIDDCVVADEGEELDGDIYVQEGYGAL